MSFTTALTRAYLTRSLRPFRFTDTYDKTLNYKNAEKLGLYVHIPFCRSLCSFCPYCKTVYDENTAKEYVEALLGEIALVGGAAGGEKKKVTSLYFGGGTPALLSNEIGRIIKEINRYFNITEGIGLELHPEDVTEENLLLLKSAGVTKISIGIQSFRPEYLKLLGRSDFNRDAMFASLRKVKFETVSMDFIFALPHQTADILKEEIETAFRSGANHVAIYPFIDFTFTDRKFPKMPEKEKKKLLYEIVDYCSEKGYTRDSVWTFSKSGNSSYSSMTIENFLGFGCSATTLLKDQFKINTFDIGAYCRRVSSGLPPTALTLYFAPRQRMVYYLFWAAYSMSVDPAAFRSFFGKRLESVYGFELWIARLLRLIRKENGRYLMTTKGAYYYHYYENFYTLSYIDYMWGMMRKEAFPRDLVIR